MIEIIVRIVTGAGHEKSGIFSLFGNGIQVIIIAPIGYRIIHTKESIRSLIRTINLPPSENGTWENQVQFYFL